MWVVNFAGGIACHWSTENRRFSWKTNIIGDGCHGCPRKYTVFSGNYGSTTAIYGATGPAGICSLRKRRRSTRPVRMDLPPRLRADLLVLAYHRTYACRVTISRRSNNEVAIIFGKLIPRMIINALHDKPLPVYGTGLMSATGRRRPSHRPLQKAAGEVYA